MQFISCTDCTNDRDDNIGCYLEMFSGCPYNPVDYREICTVTNCTKKKCINCLVFMKHIENAKINILQHKRSDEHVVRVISEFDNRLEIG